MAKPWEDYQAQSKPWEDFKPTVKPESENEAGVIQGITEGALRGAADIGNTLINASTFIPRKVESMAGGNAINDWNANRESGLDQWTQQHENDPGFTTGRIGGQIAGTAGMGNVVAPLAGLTKIPMLANSVRNGGLLANSPSLGVISNYLTKMAGGAIGGAASSALINPESAGTGAALGAAIPAVAPAVKAAGGLAANVIGGIGTFTGGESLKQAAKAGLEGGKKLASFTDNMRGNVPIDDVLTTAKTDLQRMAQEKALQYRTGMASVSKDKSVLTFDGIDQAVSKANNIANFKGQVTNQKAADLLQEARDTVAQWKSLDPAEFHTPEGLDALKQKIGGILESIPFENKTARMMIGGIYNSIKSEIVKQAPTYAKVMKDYSDASDLIREIERSLSLNPKAAIDTSIRKLQSLMRNNVNTNYGNRIDLARKLEEQGGSEIMPSLAGQALNTWTPRGLGSVVAGGIGLGSAAVGGPAAAAAAIPALAFQSPRLMGEAALKAGQAARIGKQFVIPSEGAIANLLYGE